MNIEKLMQNSFSAHKHFKEIWRLWKSGKLDDAKGSKPHTEPNSIKEARNNFLNKNDLLFNLKIEPLERNFSENPEKYLGEVINFLLVDITAFRCGYAKEIFLQKLKQIKFSEKEKEQLTLLLTTACEIKSFRREFRKYCQLSVKIADKKLIADLENLLKSENLFARIKANWMLSMIKQNRVDLRN